jgi:hypothetical protein
MNICNWCSIVGINKFIDLPTLHNEGANVLRQLGTCEISLRVKSYKP